MPHSEISGSKPVNDSPKLIAACHVLHRLPMPRHPPLALSSLSIKLDQTTKVLLRILETRPEYQPHWCDGGDTAGAPGLPRCQVKDLLYSTIQLSKIVKQGVPCFQNQRSEERVYSKRVNPLFKSLFPVAAGDFLWLLSSGF